MKNGKAFTLIELLIVVAIIGILAAIAVPNFLNAQVRARIARTQSDQRNIGTALDMYFVDTNIFPPTAPDPWYLTGVVYLTTPTAYMAEYPWDSFESTQEGAGLPGGLKHAKMMYYNVRTTYLTGQHAGGTDFARPEYEQGYRWALRSIGPNKKYDNNNLSRNQGSMDFYDSSNGLRSIGDIWLWGS